MSGWWTVTSTTRTGLIQKFIYKYFLSSSSKISKSLHYSKYNKNIEEIGNCHFRESHMMISEKLDEAFSGVLGWLFKMLITPLYRLPIFSCSVQISKLFIVWQTLVMKSSSKFFGQISKFHIKSRIFWQFYS